MDSLRDEISRAIEQAGLEEPAGCLLDTLVVHAAMMLEANALHNLTRIVEERDVAFLHVVDSLTALPHLRHAPDGPLADIGSGAGYPGIPLALASGRRLTLVESRGKKAEFLKSVLGALQLDGDVFAQRVEELPNTLRGTFAAVTARALAPLPSLVELAAPLLADGGLLIALKGEPAPEELASGDRVAEIVGMERVCDDAFVLPVVEARRTIVCYRRRGTPSVRLPRRTGLAQHKPLA